MHRSHKTTPRTAIIYWFFTICYMGLIFYFSSIKSAYLPRIPPGLDKILHTGIYTVFACLSYFSFLKSGVRKYVFVISFVFAVVYGITDEFHQLYVPGREASIGDVVADSFGALLGSYAANIVSVRKSK